jgi:hypothetical protein
MGLERLFISLAASELINRKIYMLKFIIVSVKI